MESKEIFQHMVMPELNVSCMALCTLGLQEYEFQTYITLLRNGPMSVNELKDKIQKSRPSAQRIVSHLLSKGLVYRKRDILFNGGYIYVYHAISIDKFKEKMKNNLEEWYNKSIEVINSIDDKLDF
jgi:predicted transcriptional regulator